MHDADWLELKYFHKEENWGNPEMMSKDLLFKLDKFRWAIGSPILISCGTGGQHVERSYHYSGLAVDILFPGVPLPALKNLFLEALKWNFTGIGLYTHWVAFDSIGGMHLDVRPVSVAQTWISEFPGKYSKASWEAIEQAFD